MDHETARATGDDDRAAFDAVLARCAELAATAEHMRGFAEILTTRTGERLGDWIIAVRAADQPHLHPFASSLERDWDAVVQGLTSRWNSGPAEGRVNRIKMLKRQMYGRAGLPLLRKRVLLTRRLCLGYLGCGERVRPLITITKCEPEPRFADSHHRRLPGWIGQAVSTC